MTFKTEIDNIDFPPFFSVLTKTISDILNISENDREKAWSSFESLEFRQLDLPSKEWDRLYWHGIYREDSLENILAFSMGYICKLWNEESKFNEIITAILNLIGRVLDRDVAMQLNDIDDENNIFDDNQIETLNNLIISPTFVPRKIIDNLYDHGILKWQDIAEFSEKQIIKRFGFTVKALNLINCLLELYPLSRELVSHILFLDNHIEKDSFKSLMQSWVLHREANNIYVQIFMKRMGWHENKAETLESIAQQHGVTRERIRQIENKLTAKLFHSKAVRALLPLWIVIDSLLQSSNGIVSVSELAELLQHHYKWEEKPTFSGLNNLIRFCPEEIIRKNSDNHKPMIIFSKDFSCGNCHDINVYLLKIMVTAEEMSIDNVIESLNVFCKTECSKDYPPKFMFNKSFIDLLLMDSTLKKKLLKKEDALYHIDTWKLRHGRISNVAETVLKQSGRAMHFTEVFSKIKKIKPDDSSIKERNVYAVLDRSINVLLWDRGTFIHKKNAVFPYNLIRKVEEWIKEKLKQNIPFISVHGAFKAFQNRCIQEGIHSEYALYSCLKASGERSFAFLHFPFVYQNSSKLERMPMPLIIEEFIKEAGGPVSMHEIREFAIEGINVKQFMLNQYIDRAPNIIRIKRGTYLHTDYLKIEEQKLSEIISYVRSILSKERHISVKKIFNDKKITCKLMGIHSPEALFSVLQLKASDRIHVQSYPQIRLMGDNDTEKRGILKAISLYISNKKAPCPIQELYEHYVEHLGYNERTIYWATYGDDEIYHYLRGCVIHKDTINWIEEKQEHIERVARNIYKQSVKTGSCYGLIDTLIESDALPQLGNDVYWTQLLISDLLKCQNNFIVIGSRKNVFLPLPNEFGIQTFEDFLYEILKRDYNGAINLEILNEELADSGIIAKGVTKNMLDKSTKVTIVGYEIMLTELAHHA